MKYRLSHPTAVVLAFILLLVVGLRLATAQSIPQPVLAITAITSNQLSIKITNGVSYGIYDLYTTPVLGNAAYPWTAAVIGTTGQTNFTVPIIYQTSFYRAVIDTNTVPLWQVADPAHPELGILAVFIDSPTTGSNLTQ